MKKPYSSPILEIVILEPLSPIAESFGVIPGEWGPSSFSDDIKLYEEL